MFLYQVVKNDNETLTVSQSMVKAINHAYISMVQDTFKNITIWKDGVFQLLIMTKLINVELKILC